MYLFSFCDDSIVNHVINTLLINLVILQQIPLYDFIRRREATGSLARVHALVQKEREAYGKNLILLDLSLIHIFEIFASLKGSIFDVLGLVGKDNPGQRLLTYTCTCLLYTSL